mmetsp:Transcript_16778/g.38851  ORF Transcript_16778/g.38851 Transcript_16778/m.38851 type:complete len:145 (+) Transcript_16778:67-501(+)
MPGKGIVRTVWNGCEDATVMHFRPRAGFSAPNLSTTSSCCAPLAGSLRRGVRASDASSFLLGPPNVDTSQLGPPLFGKVEHKHEFNRRYDYFDEAGHVTKVVATDQACDYGACKESRRFLYSDTPVGEETPEHHTLVSVTGDSR